MRAGKKYPWYGQIRVAENPEAAAIWRSRDVEPEDCQPFGMSGDYITDEPRNLWIEHGAALWSLVDSVCTPKESKALRLRLMFDMTLEEAGAAFGVGRERVRQIENKALRKLRMHVSKDALLCIPTWTPVRPPVYAWEVPL